jgi:hypothetical protein
MSCDESEISEGDESDRGEHSGRIVYWVARPSPAALVKPLLHILKKGLKLDAVVPDWSQPSKAFQSTVPVYQRSGSARGASSNFSSADEQAEREREKAERKPGRERQQKAEYDAARYLLNKQQKQQEEAAAAALDDSDTGEHSVADDMLIGLRAALILRAERQQKVAAAALDKQYTGPWKAIFSQDDNAWVFWNTALQTVTTVSELPVADDMPIGLRAALILRAERQQKADRQTDKKAKTSPSYQADKQLVAHPTKPNKKVTKAAARMYTHRQEQKRLLKEQKQQQQQQAQAQSNMG